MYGEIVKEKAIDFIYKNIRIETHLMIECLANFENFSVLPQCGGLLDQSPLFVEALRIWNSARHVFGVQKEKIKNIVEKLGARNVKK